MFATVKLLGDVKLLGNQAVPPAAGPRRPICRAENRYEHLRSHIFKFSFAE